MTSLASCRAWVIQELWGCSDECTLTCESVKDSGTVQSIISLTFDDGLRCQFESALPILNSHGIRATFFLIANRNPTHDLWSGHTHDWWKIQWRDDDVAMLRQLVQDGHEIGSHSVTHHPTEMPKQPALEACESKKLIEGWIGTRVSSFCYPFYRSMPSLLMQ